MPQKDIPWTLRSISGDTRLSPSLNTIWRKGILEAAEGRKGEGEWGGSAWYPPNEQCYPNKPEAICKFKSFLEQESPFQEQFFFFFPSTNTIFFFLNQGKKKWNHILLSTDSYEKAERMYRCQSQLKLRSTNPPSPECPTHSAAPTTQVSQHTKGTLQSSFLPISKILASALKVLSLVFSQGI